MNPNNQNDPRSPKRFEWIAEARKVKPIVLEPPHDIRSGKIESRDRQNLAGLEPYAGPWERSQVRHLLSRVLFGVRKSDLDYFTNLQLEGSLNKLFEQLPLPDPPVNDYEGIDENAKDPHVGFRESWLNAPHAGNKEGLRIVSLKSWMIKNFLEERPNIRQKLVLFWSNMLATKIWDVYIAKTSYPYLEMLHRNAFGNYKTFIKELTLDPSMLIFLNGAANTKEAPDENYARELQELFCIGKGPDAKFTESDVQAAARVLTGWTVSWEKYENEGPFTSRFNVWAHDTSDKQFSEFYGNKVIQGKAGFQGADELDDMLDMIFENNETANYVVRRLYAYFVSNEITDQTEEEIIQPLAQLFRDENYELEPVLRKLLGSAHFFEQANKGVLIKSPADHLLGLWRTLNVNRGGNGLQHELRVHRSMHWQMAGIGMEMGDPPNVAGWAAYYQAPQYDKAWITTDTITRRAGNTDSLIFWGFWIDQNLQIKADLVSFVASLKDPADPNSLLEEVALLLHGLELSEEVRNNLKSALLSGQLSDHYWTDAWYAYLGNSREGSNERIIVHTRLQAVFRQLLQLGEYHLM